MTAASDLSLLYIGYFNRLPDPEGLAFWEGVLASGFPLNDAAEDFSTQAEAIAIYDHFAPVSKGTPVQFLNEVYENLFNRPPDAAGLTFWTQYLESGGSVGDAILTIINGAAPADQATLDAKLELAELWYDQLAQNPELVFSDLAIAASRNALNQAGTDATSQAEALDDAALFFANAPTLTFTQTLSSVREDANTGSRTKVGDIAVFEATDIVNDVRLTGPNADQFEIIGTEVFLKADAALDFETSPTLSVTVEVDDPRVAGSPDDTATFTISVRDVVEQPVAPTPVNNAATVALITAVTDLAEDADVTTRTKVADIVVTDDGRGTNTLALAGTDAALFEIDVTELFLRANATLDFETNAMLDVSVTVDDTSVAGMPDDTAALTITLSDVNDAPTVALMNATTSLAENADTTARIKVADVVVNDDDLGTNAIALSGADAALFEIVGTELFLQAGAALDFETNATLDVSVTVDDASVGATPDDTTALQIAVGDVNEAPTLALTNETILLAENTDTTARIKVADLVVDDDALGTNTLTLSGADAVLFEIVGTELFLQAGAALDFETNATLDVTVTLDDVSVGATPDGTAALQIAVGDILDQPIELSELELSSDTRGFVINGVSTFDNSGRSLSSAGDVNGDGFDDLIIGAFFDDPNGSNSGASFVVFGKADGAAVALSAIQTDSNSGGFVINGVSTNDNSGRSVSSAGDVNGDGFDDLIIGAPFDDPNGDNSGASFVVFGKGDGTAVELSAIEMNSDTGGFVINGVSANDNSGRSVSSAGDVNGDGFDDLIVGAYRDDPNGASSGASFVIFGKGNGAAVELSDVEAGTGGFVINGISTNDNSGRSVSSAGDVNGDGFDDLIIGAPFDNPNGDYSGASFVVFGKEDGTAVELSDVEAGTGGFVINGVSAGDQSGRSVSSAGDVNGDGFDDLIIGARGDDPNGSYSGASFVVFGKGDGTAVELSDVEAGTGGFVINGVSAGDQSGRSVSSAGDVNGDGFDDLIIGAPYDDPNGGAGASFVVFGKGDGTAIELSNVEAGEGGFVINGVSAEDRSGFSVSSAGDVNGDGFDDLIIGAPYDEPNDRNSGASFVVFGGDFTGAATQVGGTGVDNLTGTAGNDNIFAGTSDDTIESSAGSDRLSGGNGADTFIALDVLGTTTLIDFSGFADGAGSENDQMDVSAFAFASFAALQGTFSAADPGGHDTRIALDGDTTIVLIGVETTDLTASDFIL